MIRVLTGATLIDGIGAPPVPDAAVVIDGERIAATGPRAAVTWPAAADVIDVRGRTLMPGPIDAHDHMASHGYGLTTRFGLDEPASTAHDPRRSGADRAGAQGWRRLRRPARGLGLRGPRLHAVLQPRVQRVAQVVAERVDGEHGDKDGPSRNAVSHQTDFREPAMEHAPP